MQKNLRMSEKSSTFAPAFEKRAVSLAQLVEQLTLNQWVESSSLSGDTKDTFECLFFYPNQNIFIFWQIYLHMSKKNRTFAPCANSNGYETPYSFLSCPIDDGGNAKC